MKHLLIGPPDERHKAAFEVRAAVFLEGGVAQLHDGGALTLPVVVRWRYGPEFPHLGLCGDDRVEEGFVQRFGIGFDFGAAFQPPSELDRPQRMHEGG